MRLMNNFKECNITIMVTGSGGLALSKWLNIPFIQEVVASTYAIENIIPRTNVAIRTRWRRCKDYIF